MGRRLGLHPALQVPGHERVEGGGEIVRPDIADTRLADQKGCQPVGRARGQRCVAQVRIGLGGVRARSSQEGDALPTLVERLRPGEPRDASAGDGPGEDFGRGQRRRHRYRLLCQSDGPKSPVASRPQRQGGGIGEHLFAGPNFGRADGFDLFRRNRRSGENARGPRAPGDFGNGEPRLPS